MCVIDETIAFMGGFDLCFGRWDTPGHTLIDDGTVGLEAIDKAFNGEGPAVDEDDVQIWPGKGASAEPSVLRFAQRRCARPVLIRGSSPADATRLQ